MPLVLLQNFVWTLNFKLWKQSWHLVLMIKLGIVDFQLLVLWWYHHIYIWSGHHFVTFALFLAAASLIPNFLTSSRGLCTKHFFSAIPLLHCQGTCGRLHGTFSLLIWDYRDEMFPGADDLLRFNFAFWHLPTSDIKSFASTCRSDISTNLWTSK